MLPMMTDKQMSDIGIVRLGDQIAVRAYCEKTNSGQENDCPPHRKSELLRRLKEKRNQLMSCREKGATPSTSNTSALARKSKRRVDVGWLNYDIDMKSYTQVRQRTGGGTRKMSVNVQATFRDLLEESKQLFFPHGVSNKGMVDEFEFTIRSFDHTELELDLTIGELLERTKVKLLHVYLTTISKVNEHGDITTPSVSSFTCV